MGLIRLLLAVAVFLNHTGPLFGISLTGGLVAVQSFYIVSGFYMGLILTEKYVGPGRYSLFLTNRLLKILPAYWVIAFLTVAVSIVGYVMQRDPLFLWPFLTGGPTTRGFPLVFAIATNLSLFGQDAAMFLEAVEPASLRISSDFRNDAWPMSSMLLVPQAWTLSIELTFYLIAPLLVSKGARTLLLIACGSLLFRLLLYRNGLNHDPWTYRFFPTELAFFTAGILSHRLYHVLKPKAGLLPLAATVALIGLIVFFPALGSIVTKWGFYLCVLGLLPFVFVDSKNRKWDRRLGELSYPFYLSHMFVLGVTAHLRAGAPNGLGYAVALFLTLGVSLLLTMLLNRLERFRQQRVSKVTSY